MARRRWATDGNQCKLVAEESPPSNWQWPEAIRVGESLGSGAETTQPILHGMTGVAPDFGMGFDETANPTGAS